MFFFLPLSFCKRYLAMLITEVAFSKHSFQRKVKGLLSFEHKKAWHYDSDRSSYPHTCITLG